MQTVDLRYVAAYRDIFIFSVCTSIVYAHWSVPWFGNLESEDLKYGYTYGQTSSHVHDVTIWTSSYFSAE